ncbi:MAG: hypothetical protein JO102_01370, partial [Elusimicrobia bacterium]|nr:hypothetical protein [Elusimicrobiota bacterium]
LSAAAQRLPSQAAAATRSASDIADTIAAGETPEPSHLAETYDAVASVVASGERPENAAVARPADARTANFARAGTTVFVRIDGENGIWISLTRSSPTGPVTVGPRVQTKEVEAAVRGAKGVLVEVDTPSAGRKQGPLGELLSSLLGAVRTGLSPLVSGKMIVSVIAALAILVGDPTPALANAFHAAAPAAAVATGSGIPLLVIAATALTVALLPSLPATIRLGKSLLADIAANRDRQRQLYAGPVTGPTIGMPTADGKIENYRLADLESLRALGQTNAPTETAALAALYPGNIIGPAEPLRHLEISNAPSITTPKLINAANELASLGTDDKPQWGRAPDTRLAGDLNRLASDPDIGQHVRNVLVGKLLADALAGNEDVYGGLDPALTRAHGNWAANLTLGDVMDMTAAPTDAVSLAQFKDFVYQLVAHHAQAINGERWSVIPDVTIERASRQRGNNPIVMVHTHNIGGDHIELGPADTLSLAAGADNASLAPVGIIAGRQGVLAFNPMGGMSIDLLNPAAEIKPVATPYQITRVKGALGTETESDQMRSLRGEPRRLPEQQLAAGRALLDLAASLNQPGVDEKDRENVWLGIAAAVVSDGPFDFNAFLREDFPARTSVEALMGELTRQMRSIPSAVNLAATGHLPAIGMTVKSFLDVSALPAEREWLLGHLGEAFDMPLMDAAAAQKLVDDLEAWMKVYEQSGYGDRLFRQLSLLTGALRSDFFSTVNRWMQILGLATDSGSVRRVLSGQPGAQNDRTATTVALASAIEPLALAMAQAAGIRIDEKFWETLNSLRVELPDQLDPVLSHGKAGLAVRGKEAWIQILIDQTTVDRQTKRVRPTTDAERMTQAIGRLTHELGHVFFHRAVEKAQVRQGQSETLAEEAWVALMTSRTLRLLKLDAVAQAIDLDTAHRVVDMQNLEVVYIDVAALRSGPKDKDNHALQEKIRALDAQVNASGGKKRVVLVAATPADFDAAVAARTGIQVFRTSEIDKMTPDAGKRLDEAETKIEAHARLYLGTRRVKFYGADWNENVWIDLVRAEIPNVARQNLPVAIDLLVRVSGGLVLNLNAMSEIKSRLKAERRLATQA